MVEITIYGRGGQGGVTLAKLIAQAYFLQGKHVQAFGVYAAERSGAPLQAFVRIDDREITNHNQVRQPDHVVVLDRTLIGPRVLTGHKPEGWIVLNSPDKPEQFGEMFAGRQVATVNATAIAVDHGLGTRTVPIVNTTILGAVGRLLGLELPQITATLEQTKFGGANEEAAKCAYECVATQRLAGEATAVTGARPTNGPASLFDECVGGHPAIHTGDWATRRPDRRELTPPCNHGCPAGNDVRSFLTAAGEANYDAALEILLETSPLPGICGRVCPAPCMESCNRAEFDDAVNVREVERFVAEQARHPEPSEPWRSERVAVVGSGPGGLSAAYHLARLGYRVTMFEADSELGGVMRTGIPEYRLPRDVLDNEIDFILKHGVDVRTGKSLVRREMLKLTREYSAVFIATGLQDSRPMDLGSNGSTIVEQGLEFLERTRHRPDNLIGKVWVVIGGGNTAIDAARTARRMGAHVHILYRRSRDEMPAIKEEIEEALEEGIALDELVSPLRLREDAIGWLLTCVRMKLGEPDASGRPRPIPETTDDAFFDVRCDRVVLALGQSANLSIVPEGSEVHEGESLMGLTGAPVFCGGDFASNDGTVAAAIGSGRRAALHMHRTLTGEDLFPPKPEPLATPRELTMHVFTHAPRRDGGMTPMGQRRHSFSEVRLGLDELDAVSEAQRCFSCGTCNECDRCVGHCPEGILVRDGHEYRFDYEYCKGCGVCAEQCPRGVIYMSEL